MNRVIASLILATLLFSACGQIVQIGGVVIDARTRRPITGAIVKVGIYDRWSVIDTTDADGRFHTNVPARGMACGVPPARVYIDRPGYTGRREIYAGTKLGTVIALEPE